MIEATRDTGVKYFKFFTIAKPTIGGNNKAKYTCILRLIWNKCSVSCRLVATNKKYTQQNPNCVITKNTLTIALKQPIPIRGLITMLDLRQLIELTYKVDH